MNSNPDWEWLALRTPWDMDLRADSPLGPDYQRVEVRWGDSWELQGVARGTKRDLPARSPTRRGEFVVRLDPIELESEEAPQRTVVDGAWDGSFGAKLVIDPSGNSAFQVELDFGLDRLTAFPTFGPLPLPTVCAVWCLNGPSEDFFWPNRTFRRDGTIRHRPPEETDFGPGSYSNDWIRLDPLPGRPAATVLAKVPSEVVPSGRRTVAVEFPFLPEGDPTTWELVDEYIDALSFACGRPLDAVGYTYFNAERQPLLHHLRSSTVLDAPHLASRPSQPPVPVTLTKDLKTFKDPGPALSEITNRVLAGFKEFDLGHVIWLLWMSDSAPLEGQLPYLASALERLTSAWYKSQRSKSSGLYLPADAWSKKSKEAIETLAKELNGEADAGAILSKAKRANEFGVNERIRRFFPEIGLPIGAVEEEALRARNVAVHGGHFNPAQYQALSLTIHAYRSLVHRTILHLIGWTGLYVDYSTFDFPSRPLADPLRGPEGDGKAAKF